jgi:hypothetical protein
MGVTILGCGSSSSSSSGSSNSGLSYSAFSNAAGKICTESKAGLNSLNSLHITTLADSIAPFKKVDGVVTSAISQFQALQGPSVLTAARDTYVSELQQFDTVVKTMISAAQGNNLSGFKSAAQSLAPLKTKTTADAAKLGPGCVNKS